MEHPPLARLLSLAASAVVWRMHELLAEEGFTGLRPAFGFAINAVEQGATSTSELARVLGMTKQGAAKLVLNLSQQGYLSASPDPDDRRVQRLSLTDRGTSLLKRAAIIQERLEADWAKEVGAKDASTARSALEEFAVDASSLRPLW
jgi:DNA-binding MarR family transcriptional regulator